MKAYHIFRHLTSLRVAQKKAVEKEYVAKK